ncbi:MAG: DNA polymerase III subunit gamma/tau [Melioribacteraceae bacterium]|nr:DNA polymerase III subunit gamma/tau [Melioribacteraceae bacterium]
MNFIVTARKWRPQTFEEVVGQEHITTTIKNAIVNNRVAHAYLFTGPRGCGKTTTARILAKTLNCLNVKDGEPCNECEMCINFLNSQTLDIIEIDGASNRRIEEIRTLRESVKYAPTKGKYKVYIIDEVHMLTTESFNALLKTLEEPPDHTIFIFATTDIHKVPLTIISRCQRFDFRRIEISTMKNHLKKIAQSENIEIDDKALTLISKKADGALRDAQSIFDQVISFSGNKVDSDELEKIFNLIDEEIYFEITDAILNKNFHSAFEVTNKIYENGWSYIDFLNGLTEHFRNLLSVTIRKDSKLVESAEIFKEKYLNYKDEFSEGDLLRILNFINKTLYEIKTSSNQKIKIEVALSQIIALEKSSTIKELINKIATKQFNTLTNYDIPREPLISQQISEKKEKINFDLKTNSKNETKLENFVLPQIDENQNISELISKWKTFIEHVQKEKFFFGSILTSSKPNINPEKIEIEIEDPQDEDIILKNKTYLNTKIQEIFGKKYNISIKNKPSLTNKNKEESNIVNTIINDLGGKEVIK